MLSRTVRSLPSMGEPETLDFSFDSRGAFLALWYECSPTNPKAVCSIGAGYSLLLSSILQPTFHYIECPEEGPSRKDN